MPVEKRLPWEPRSRTEPGPRMQNVRISDTEFGTLLTGKGATFNFGEEYVKGKGANAKLFEAVYVRYKPKRGVQRMEKIDIKGRKTIVTRYPHGIIDEQSIWLNELSKSEQVISVGGRSRSSGLVIDSILVAKWGDIPQSAVGLLSEDSTARDFHKLAQQTKPLRY